MGSLRYVKREMGRLSMEASRLSLRCFKILRAMGQQGRTTSANKAGRTSLQQTCPRKVAELQGVVRMELRQEDDMEEYQLRAELFCSVCRCEPLEQMSTDSK
jgi:hypothetical protein